MPILNDEQRQKLGIADSRCQPNYGEQPEAAPICWGKCAAHGGGQCALLGNQRAPLGYVCPVWADAAFTKLLNEDMQ